MFCDPQSVELALKCKKKLLVGFNFGLVPQTKGGNSKIGSKLENIYSGTTSSNQNLFLHGT